MEAIKMSVQMLLSIYFQLNRFSVYPPYDYDYESQGRQDFDKHFWPVPICIIILFTPSLCSARPTSGRSAVEKDFGVVESRGSQDL